MAHIFKVLSTWVFSCFYPMDQVHSSSTPPTVTTQASVTTEVVPDGTRTGSLQWVDSPGGDQTQLTCLGVGQTTKPERSENDRLCSTCMSLGRPNSTHWEEINNSRKVIVDHHHSFDALSRSAREGCHLCTLLLMAWEEEHYLEQESGDASVNKSGCRSYYLNFGISLGFQRMRMTIPQTGVIVDELQIEIKTRTRSGISRPGIIGQLICKAMDDDHLTLPTTCLPSSEDTNTGSSASLSRIKAWLDICSSSHPACAQAGSQPPPLPTRVIEVGGKESSKCYLVSGKKRNGYYASLSHCWGDPRNRPLSTTDRTLSCRQRGIEDEALPKTFRDAVKVCREIGIKYIWIDSLCIIQEQEAQEDWAKEAPKMGQVYGNSILNISAAAAADSTQGCFRKRLGLNSWPCPVVLFGQACYLFRYPTMSDEERGNPGDAHSESNLLARRAWVLQEQILSRRSIIFSKHRLIWRCPTLSTNEKYPLGNPHAPHISFDNHRLLYCILNGIIPSVTKESTTDSYRCWYRTVEEFTSRNLTYEEDRLPAIAGIAKRFGEAVDDSYLAGLFRHDMIFGLLWARKWNHVKCTAKSTIVPSWSWASINDCVEYPYPFRTANPNESRSPLSPLVDILDFSDPITCEDHPFGVTSRASLGLSGILLSLMQNNDGEVWLNLVKSRICISDKVREISWDIRGFASLDPALLVCLPICVLHECEHLGTHSSDESYKASWKMPLKMGRGEDYGCYYLYFLVLQTIEGYQDTYRRVGLYSERGTSTRMIDKIALSGERRSITII